MAVKKKRKISRILLKSLLIAVCCAVLGSLLITLPLRWVDPPATAFILREQGLSATRLQRTWVSLDRVAPGMALAVVASEDQKFPLHSGFDLASLEKALTEKRARMRGASTITQQLAKNLYLWPGRSLFRKGVEAWFTLFLEACLTKKRIMEIYLNVVEFGPGTYGVKRAAKYHFDKGPERLSPRESALLAAVLPNPKVMNAGKPSDYVNRRADQILKAMRDLGGTAYLPW